MKPRLPTLDVALLVLVYDALESGNAKDAWEQLDEAFKEVTKENPADLFRALQNAAYDRPSAWWFYTGLIRNKKLAKLELAMNAEAEDKKVKEVIRKHFDSHATQARGREAFRVLFSRYWDT